MMSEIFLSDLPYSVITNGWGPVERDASNGERDAGDGRLLTINGRTYSKGLGVHARSVVEVALDGAYTRFLADVGVDDEVGRRGAVIFRVLADDLLLYDSGPVTGRSRAQGVDVDVSGRSRLRLIVEPAKRKRSPRCGLPVRELP